MTAFRINFVLFIGALSLIGAPAQAERYERLTDEQTGDEYTVAVAQAPKGESLTVRCDSFGLSAKLEIPELTGHAEIFQYRLDDREVVTVAPHISPVGQFTLIDDAAQRFAKGVRYASVLRGEIWTSKEVLRFKMPFSNFGKQMKDVLRDCLR